MLATLLEEGLAVNVVEGILKIHLEEHLSRVGGVSVKPLSGSMHPYLGAERLRHANLQREQQGGGPAEGAGPDLLAARMGRGGGLPAAGGPTRAGQKSSGCRTEAAATV